MSNKTRKVALAAAVCALSAGVYAEQSGTVGQFEMAIQETEYDYWGDSYTPWRGFRVAGSSSAPVTANHAVQVDFKGFNVADKSDNGYYPVHGLSGAAHFIWDMEAVDLGVLAGALATNGYYSSGSDINLFYAGEARTGFTDSVSLHGQVGVLENRKSYYRYNGTVTFGQAVVTGFVGNNLMLEGTLGIIKGGVGDTHGEDAKTHTWGARAEFGFLKSLSAFIDVSGHKDDDHWKNSNFDTVTTSIGLNFGFGAESLKARHHAAPAMKPMNFDAISWLRIDGY